MTFRKIPVANRGEIAGRIFRTCRALGVGTVAVHSEADKGAARDREADEAVLSGRRPGTRIVRAALLCQDGSDTGSNRSIHFPARGFPGRGLPSKVHRGRSRI